MKSLKLSKLKKVTNLTKKELSKISGGRQSCGCICPGTNESAAVLDCGKGVLQV